MPNQVLLCGLFAQSLHGGNCHKPHFADCIWCNCEIFVVRLQPRYRNSPEQNGDDTACHSYYPTGCADEAWYFSEAKERPFI